MSNITKEDSPLQQEGCGFLLWLSNATRQGQRRRYTLLLQNIVVLANLISPILRQKRSLLAAENDLLKQKHVIFSINIGLCYDKDVVQEELAKVFEMVTFPVVDAVLQTLHSLFVFSAALCLIDLICDAFSCIRPSLEFIKMLICRGR